MGVQVYEGDGSKPKVVYAVYPIAQQNWVVDDFTNNLDAGGRSGTLVFAEPMPDTAEMLQGMRTALAAGKSPLSYFNINGTGYGTKHITQIVEHNESDKAVDLKGHAVDITVFTVKWEIGVYEIWKKELTRG
jgi:hypothetical protein